MSRQPYSPYDAVQTYATQAVEGAAPERLTLMVFDYILACIRRREVMKAKKGVVELMGTLDLDYLEIAGPLYRLYEYCLDLIRAEKFDEAEHLLGEIRQAWSQVVDKVESEKQVHMENLEL